MFKYSGAEVYFNYIKRGDDIPIIFLHGWGRSGDDFESFASQIYDRSILLIDFPPFGKSQHNVTGWNIFTYAGMVMSLCEHLNISKGDFVGHSFGGRVTIMISAVKCTLVHSCIFIDSAGMKPRRSLKYRYNQAIYKIKRKIKKSYRQKGSTDYEALSPAMKETFKNIVNTHLEAYAKKIKAKTLIVWGLQDNETPIYMARRLNKLIAGSELKILNDGGHFSFLDCKLEFFRIVNEFYKEV